jgi:hypothetical protein
MRAPRTNGRVGRARTSALAAATAATATVVVALGGCAQEAQAPDAAIVGDVGEFAATSEYLAGVADAADGQTYRMAMDMTMHMDMAGESLDVGGSFMTGEVDGATSSMTMDLGALFDDIAAQVPADEAPPDDLLDADLTMEMVTDGETLYLRAPYFASMADMALDIGATRSDLGPLADLAELDDEWGRIDLDSVTPSEVATTAGAQTPDPRVFLDMAAQGTDVHELGTQTIDGAETQGLAATVTYEDMVTAQGMDADDVRDQMTPNGGPAGNEVADEIVDAMFAMDMPVEVWIDADDHVRRISMTMDMASMFASLDEPGMGEGAMAIDFTIDFSDYGDESIQIDLPTESTDITDEFLELQEGGGLGGTTPGASGGSVLGAS